MRSSVRALTVIASVTALLGFGVTVAAPAQALAPDILDDGCQQVDYRLPVGTTVGLYYNGTSCVFDYYDTEPGFTSPYVQDDTSGGTGWIYFTVTGERDFGQSWPNLDVSENEQWITGCGVTYAEGDYYPTVVDLCPKSGGTPPPSWYQSYGRGSADEKCLEGWTPSWEEWMNDGRGGYVCSREIYWNTQTGEWATR